MTTHHIEVKLHGADEVEAAAKRATAAVNELVAALDRLRVVASDGGEAPEDEPATAADQVRALWRKKHELGQQLRNESAAVRAFHISPSDILTDVLPIIARELEGSAPRKRGE